MPGTFKIRLTFRHKLMRHYVSVARIVFFKPKMASCKPFLINRLQIFIFLDFGMVIELI